MVSGGKGITMPNPTMIDRELRNWRLHRPQNLLGFPPYAHATGNIYNVGHKTCPIPDGSHITVYIQTMSTQPDGHLIKTAANFTYLLKFEDEKVG